MLAKQRIALQMERLINQTRQRMTVSFRMVYVAADTPRVMLVDGPNALTLLNISSFAATAGEKMIMANAKA